MKKTLQRHDESINTISVMYEGDDQMMFTFRGILQYSDNSGTSNTSRRRRCCNMEGLRYLEQRSEVKSSSLPLLIYTSRRTHLQTASKHSSMASRWALVSEQPLDRR